MGTSLRAQVALRSGDQPARAEQLAPAAVAGRCNRQASRRIRQRRAKRRRTCDVAPVLSGADSARDTPLRANAGAELITAAGFLLLLQHSRFTQAHQRSRSGTEHRDQPRGPGAVARLPPRQPWPGAADRPGRRPLFELPHSRFTACPTAPHGSSACRGSRPLTPGQDIRSPTALQSPEANGGEGVQVEAAAAAGRSPRTPALRAPRPTALRPAQPADPQGGSTCRGSA